ncbi:GIY-YIG nuclease family protein [Entomohabitans teleogrylli]|uniref:GIY-YIG nuclease family protein n=1 Tax=Entomohabitans teleogrylli TaxID=1384589 RepID=UPI00073D85AC|nr:GIY-YIG nuclease family protein [Entomohabitans teleogrylli]
MSDWFLYLIRTADDRLYTGITTDVTRRLTQHQRGKGAKALRGKGELILAYSTPVGDRSRALRAEYRIKQLSKAHKESLVAGQMAFEDLLADLPAPLKND